MTIPFPTGPKSFHGTFDVYQWARGGTGALVAASALMALEAWAHRQIESGRPVADVLDDVLGPSGSSSAFVCVAVDLVLSHGPKAKEIAWPMLATPELLHFDQMRFTQDVSGLGRFAMPGQELAHWRVKAADLMARPSRRHRLIELIGDYTVNGPANLHAQLQQELKTAQQRIDDAAANDTATVDPLREFAARAYRMTDRAHWLPRSLRREDGQEITVHQYQPPPEDEERNNAEREIATAHYNDLGMRLAIQKALSAPEIATAEIVPQAIAWAKSHSLDDEAMQLGDANDPEGDNDAADEFERRWTDLAVIMAAALAVRDYDAPDRTEVETWARPILERAGADEAAAGPAITEEHIYSDKAATAALSYAAIYARSRDTKSCEALLWLASRGSQAVLQSIGSQLGKLAAVDARLGASLTRIVSQCCVYPRRTMVPSEEAANQAALLQRRTEAVDQELRRLEQQGPEPAWPQLESWHSRRRRGFRIGGDHDPDELEEASRPREWYVDEHGLGTWVGHLVRLTIGDVPEWIVSFTHHMLAWTVDANNGPPGDDEHEREHRPTHWNMCYFDFLGILCVALPFQRVRTIFLEPMARLHDEAFHDAIGSFLRGFDRATLATDTKEPDDPCAVRAFIVERLCGRRMMERLNYQLSFTAETHLADALNALFYQPSRWQNSDKPYIPSKWDGLRESFKLLTPLLVAAPNSGYLAVIFLRLIESYPGAALLPEMVRAASAWSKAHSAGSSFWTEHQIGHRLCAWIDAVASDDELEATAISQLHDDLRSCLDILVQSGIATAHALETHLNMNSSKRRTA